MASTSARRSSRALASSIAGSGVLASRGMTASLVARTLRVHSVRTIVRSQVRNAALICNALR